MAKKFTVYTIDNCPFCTSAKALLSANNLEFDEIYVDKTDQEKLIELVQRSGMRTFPQIYLGDDLVGGFTELKQLHDEKDLKNIV